MYLCLDLSLKCSGWAKFNKNGKLMKKGRISPDKDIDNCSKIHYIVSQINFTGIDEVIIEDVYYNPNVKNFKTVVWLCRLARAVATEWVNTKYKVPIWYVATKARKLVGINGRAHKSEIQIFVLDKYKLATKTKIGKYKKQIEKLREEFPVTFKRKLTKAEKDQNKKMRSRLKYRLDKLTELILKETEYGENICDAIILGLAYQEDKNEKN